MTRPKYLPMVLTCAALSLGSNAQSDPDPKHFLPMDKSLVPLHSPEGRKLLRESEAEEAFWHLAQFYATQPDRGSCSVASSTMVLNALPIKRPNPTAQDPSRLFTPDNFFTPGVNRVFEDTLKRSAETGDPDAPKTARELVSRKGMTLQQVANCLKTYPVKVDVVFAADSTIDEFRKALAATLSHPDGYIIVNYLRRSLRQEKDGHLSPLGAFNQKKDMVLILDTANYKYPWTWVSTDQLWKAMAAEVDSDSNRSRGYLVVYTESKK